MIFRTPKCVSQPKKVLFLRHVCTQEEKSEWNGKDIFDVVQCPTDIISQLFYFIFIKFNILPSINGLVIPDFISIDLDLDEIKNHN